MHFKYCFLRFSCVLRCGVLLKIHEVISVKNGTKRCCKLLLSHRGSCSTWLQHCSTACFSPVRVRLLVGQAPGGHRAEAGARPRLGVVRVQAGVQRQVRHLLIWKQTGGKFGIKEKMVYFFQKFWRQYLTSITVHILQYTSRVSAHIF